MYRYIILLRQKLVRATKSKSLNVEVCFLLYLYVYELKRYSITKNKIEV